MSLTPLQRKQRASGIGASEVAAIMGFDPHRSAWDVWAEKTGKVEPFEGNEFTERGNWMEEPIARRVAEMRRRRIVKPTGTYRCPTNDVIFANVDRQFDKAERGFRPLEIKDTCVPDGWGDPETDQIPDRTSIQLTVQLACVQAMEGEVARNLHTRWGPDIALYVVPFYPEMWKRIEEATVRFWNDNVEKDIPPDGSTPSFDAAARLIRRAGVVQVISEGTYLDWSKARRARLDAEKAEEAACAKLLAEMMGADEARIGDGTLVATNFQSRDSERFDAEAFKAQHPDLWRAFLVTRPGSRRLLDKAAKKETARV